MHDDPLQRALEEVRSTLPSDVLRLEAKVVGARPVVSVVVVDELGGRPDRSFMLQNLEHRISMMLPRALRRLQVDVPAPRVRFRFSSEDGPARAVTREEVQAIVERRPEVMGGQECLRGTRIPLDLVVTMFRQGATVADILAGYPTIDLEKARIARALATAGPT